MRKTFIFTLLILYGTTGAVCSASEKIADAVSGVTAIKKAKKVSLKVIQNDTVISVYRKDGDKLLMTHISKKNNRPYIHPIIAPDGKGVMTEYRPGHHLHQTGLYWGLKLVNGRDFFMNWNENFYRQVSSTITQAKGQEVKWQTVYDLLDENKNVVLTETHNWTLQERNGKYLLDLDYACVAKTDITFGKFYVGGLFLRMPWTKGTEGQIINSMGQRNVKEAEAQRAIWADVGVKIAGRDDMGHVAILDHPENVNFPTAWRVDSQLGLGPSRQILGDWKLDKGQTQRFRFRLVFYTGDLDPEEIKWEWLQYMKEQ